MRRGDELKVETLGCETVYGGHYRVDRYTLRHETFTGGWSKKLTREVFERGHAVALLPYDPVRDRVVLIEQFRIGALAARRPAWLTEIVAGLIEPGETPEEVAHRECREEAGCAVEALVPIAEVMPSAGAVSETIALFCGKVDSSRIKEHGGAAGEGEDIRVFSVGWPEVLDGLAAGQFVSAPAIIALQWLALHREAVRKAWTKTQE